MPTVTATQAKYAAKAASEASDAASDKILSKYAEWVVQILIKMKIPRTKFFYLTEN